MSAVAKIGPSHLAYGPSTDPAQGPVWMELERMARENPFAYLSAAGQMPYASAAQEVSLLSLGTEGSLLMVNDGATAPSWLAPGTALEILGIDATSGLPTWDLASVFAKHTILDGGTYHTDTIARTAVAGDLIQGSTTAGKWQHLAGGAQFSLLAYGIGASTTLAEWTTHLLWNDSTDILTITGSATISANLTLSAHTATRVFYAGVGGLVTTDAGLTFNDSTNTFTLGTNHIYSQGAHGLTLAADDHAFGSGAASYVWWDDSVRTLYIAQNDATTTPALRIQTTTSTGVPGLEFFRSGTFAFTLYAATSGDGFRISDSSSSWPGTTLWQGRTTGQRFISTSTNANSLGSQAVFDFQGAVIRLGDAITASAFANGLGVKFNDAGTVHASFKFNNAGGSTSTFQWGRSSASADSLALEAVSFEVGLGSGTQASSWFAAYGWGNVGTTTLATAQGDLAAGLTAGNQWWMDQSSGIFYGRTAAATTAWSIAVTTGITHFNQQQADIDFRVDADVNTSAFLVDAGAAAGAGQIRMNVSGVTLGADAAPTTGFVADVQGDCRVSGGLAIGGTTVPTDSYGYAALGWTIGIAQAATANARSLEIYDGDGALSITLATKATAESARVTVFNEASQDIDFRVESNGNANALFVDGGNDNVGILTGTPSAGYALEVNGKVRIQDVLDFNYAGTAADTNVPIMINTPTGVAALQNTWVKVELNGVTGYFPLWV